jgi:very-short-patch-repair endonuclease
MDNLNSIVSFWYDCIRSEGALDQSFGLTKDFQLTSRTKAMVYDGFVDSFIFAQRPTPVAINSEKMKAITSRIELRGEQLYFGYPLLTFRDRETGKVKVAPLFIIQIEVTEGRMVGTEPYPTIGSCAFEKFGLKNEEISALNTEITDIFQARQPTMTQDIIQVVEREVGSIFTDDFNPEELTRNNKPSSIYDHTIYNRAVLFTAESSTYNLHLLKDLDEMRSRNNLESSALNYLTNPGITGRDTSFIPIMPFAYDEYQLNAIQSILGTQNSVITGPPGTGKSQFIANLIINLFMQRKKVLFVSHTGEAVRVVNERIRQYFEYLILSTGSKAVRSTIGEQLDALVRSTNGQSQDVTGSGIRMVDIENTWLSLKNVSSYIKESDSLVESLEHLKKDIDYLNDHKRLINFLKRFFVKRKYNRALSALSFRRNNYDLYTTAGGLKKLHIEQSRTYVMHRYAHAVLNGGNYGKLAAYIKSVETRKSLSRFSQPDKAEDYLPEALSMVNVWSCTLKSVGANFPLKSGIFDYVIFDEASQVDLPSAAPALYRAKNVVVVGDERQLTHIAKINADIEQQLADVHHISDLPPVSYRMTSLFSSAKSKLENREHTLLGHYRSSFGIAQIFNQVFYDQKLRIYTSDEERLLPPLKTGANWVDIKGVSTKVPSGSRRNIEEADKLVNLFAQILPHATKQQLTIGITSPYSQQTRLIADKIEKMFHKEQLQNVKVLTVHKFQGSEVDILLFSPVVSSRGNASSTMWYQQNPQILNVAISRAKQMLLIVGDREYALNSNSKELKMIAQTIGMPFHAQYSGSQPMNQFESILRDLLERWLPSTISVKPQYLVDDRYIIDFGLFSEAIKVAVELDGYQHHIVGDLAIFDDVRRDSYLKAHDWKIVRIPVSQLLKDSNSVIDQIMQQIPR